MSSDLSLHKAVFTGDLKAVEKILEKLDENQLKRVVNSQDIHGNTALHIAAMKGHESCVQLLIKNGASASIRNELNWMPLHEAISYGDFNTIKILNDALNRKIIKYCKRDFIFKFVNEIKEDFKMKFEVMLKDYDPNTIIGHPELKVCVIKKGLKIKVHLSILDYFHTRPQSFYLIFDVNSNNDKFITIIIGELPFYQTITFDYWEQTITEIFDRESSDDEIRELMGKEDISIELRNSKPADRPLFRKGGTRRVGGYHSNIHESQGIDLIKRTRTEHLRAREESTSPPESPTNERMHSLPKPKDRKVSWDEYIKAPNGKFPHLGREVIETIETNRVSIVIGLTEEISLEWKWILESAQHFLNNKFALFLNQLSKDLPKGFPVCVEFPFKHSLYAKYKLISLQMAPDIDDSAFVVPDSYHETVIFTFERSRPNLP